MTSIVPTDLRLPIERLEPPSFTPGRQRDYLSQDFNTVFFRPSSSETERARKRALRKVFRYLLEAAKISSCEMKGILSDEEQKRVAKAKKSRSSRRSILTYSIPEGDEVYVIVNEKIFAKTLLSQGMIYESIRVRRKTKKGFKKINKRAEKRLNRILKKDLLANKIVNYCNQYFNHYLEGCGAKDQEFIRRAVAAIEQRTFGKKTSRLYLLFAAYGAYNYFSNYARPTLWTADFIETHFEEELLALH